MLWADRLWLRMQLLGAAALREGQITLDTSAAEGVHIASGPHAPGVRFLALLRRVALWSPHTQVLMHLPSFYTSPFQDWDPMRPTRGLGPSPPGADRETVRKMLWQLEKLFKSINNDLAYATVGDPKPWPRAFRHAARAGNGFNKFLKFHAADAFIRLQFSLQHFLVPLVFLPRNRKWTYCLTSVPGRRTPWPAQL